MIREPVEGVTPAAEADMVNVHRPRHSIVENRDRATRDRLVHLSVDALVETVREMELLKRDRRIRHGAVIARGAQRV